MGSFFGTYRLPGYIDAFSLRIDAFTRTPNGAEDLVCRWRLTKDVRRGVEYNGCELLGNFDARRAKSQVVYVCIGDVAKFQDVGRELGMHWM